MDSYSLLPVKQGAALYYYEALEMKAGILFGFNRGWIGYHYSAYNKRACINIIPFVTVWIVFKNGVPPVKNRIRQSPPLTDDIKSSIGIDPSGFNIMVCKNDLYSTDGRGVLFLSSKDFENYTAKQQEKNKTK